MQNMTASTESKTVTRIHNELVQILNIQISVNRCEYEKKVWILWIEEIFCECEK